MENNFFNFSTSKILDLAVAMMQKDSICCFMLWQKYCVFTGLDSLLLIFNCEEIGIGSFRGVPAVGVAAMLDEWLP